MLGESAAEPAYRNEGRAIITLMTDTDNNFFSLDFRVLPFRDRQTEVNRNERKGKNKAGLRGPEFSKLFIYKMVEARGVEPLS